MKNTGTLDAISAILGGTSTTRVLPPLHQPERGADETFAEYKARRTASQRASLAATTQGLSAGVSSRKQHRDSMRQSGTMGLRMRASDALMAAWAEKRIPNWNGPRDQQGAYTLVGKARVVLHTLSDPVYGEELIEEQQPRRKWLAGISAQRGY